MDCGAANHMRVPWEVRPLTSLGGCPTVHLNLFLYVVTKSGEGIPWHPVQRLFRWIPRGLRLAKMSQSRCLLFWLVFRIALFGFGFDCK